MANNLLNKYVWLVETIYKAKRITFEEIDRKWQNCEMSEGGKLALRTFHKWRIAVEEMFGLNIECERIGGYHYYIENAEDIKNGSIRSWLLNTISVSNLLIDNCQMKDRILLEKVPSGQEHLSVIIEAMKGNRVLNITYQSFNQEESCTFDVEPYCVKLFKQRWYMLARSPFMNRLRIYALDRIQELEIETEKVFVMPEDFDGSEYFMEYYGVITGFNFDLETVRLKVSARQCNYLRSLPLHHSQKEVEQNEEYSIFEFHLRPEYDFWQEILRQGEDMEVLEPQWLRDEIAGKAEEMWNKYKENK